MLRFDDDLRTRWHLLAEFSPDAGGDDTAGLRGPAIRFFAPDRSARTDTFAADLLRDLAAVGNTEIVTQFVGNVSRALYARGRFAKCEQLVDAGLRTAPDDARLIQTKAFLLFKRGSHADALAMVERAERLGEAGLEMLALKGNILMEAGELVLAEEAFARARDLHPSAVLPHTLLIGLYSRTGDTGALAGALERYRSILPPGSPEARRVGMWLDSLKGVR
jgi:tetratricopeptide (TPR) repeat protein